MVGTKTASIGASAKTAVGGNKSNPSSAIAAKERLSVILASQRGSELLNGVDMDALQKDVLEVVKRHIAVAQNSPVNCQVKNEGEVNLFEMSVEIDSCASRNGTKGSRIEGRSGKSTVIRPARVTLQAS
eukprot:CAMPEP_0203652770 /NCGR_PEP_ID=MMETSP0088-20131115/30883_1 /ASSEMBLY_ACC=CAM_ASM_001087 /TAXON_ID=426623 /ORGANISM="Chaetoceros affinis, Strain CCMP159" /LENGTH=128 /DNA_ID=CAMNT_0050512425 /DNA_START=135 /DNA_END=521 /DNA_ORIENTATION=+